MVIVLALGVEKLPQLAAVADPLDLAVELHLGIILGQHIDGIALLKGADQLHALGHGAVADALRKNVQTALKALYGKGSVLVKIIGENNGIHTVIQKFIKIAVHLDRRIKPISFA